MIMIQSHRLIDSPLSLPTTAKLIKQ